MAHFGRRAADNELGLFQVYMWVPRASYSSAGEGTQTPL